MQLFNFETWGKMLLKNQSSAFRSSCILNLKARTGDKWWKIKGPEVGRSQ